MHVEVDIRHQECTRPCRNTANTHMEYVAIFPDRTLW